MFVKYDPISRTWEFSCIFGCWERDYATEQEATEAELVHDCNRKVLG